MLPFLIAFGAVAVGFGVFEAFDSDDDDNSEENAVLDLEPIEPGEGLSLLGEINVDDTLNGGSGDDTIIGNENDEDTLIGGTGDDTLAVSTDNQAIGGEGGDWFYVTNGGGSNTVIEDFNPAEDKLAFDPNWEDPILYQTKDGTGLRFVAPDTLDTVLTVKNTTMQEGETLEVEFISERDYDAGALEELRTSTYYAPLSSGPLYVDAIKGTSGSMTLNGTDEDDWISGKGHRVADTEDEIHAGKGDDWIFGKAGADTVFGGEGDDHLFGGSDAWVYSGGYSHFPGEVTRVGADADVLDGGAGDDTIWFGLGNTVTGGEGSDTFKGFAEAYRTPDASVITDFDPDEDQLLIDIALAPDEEVAAATVGQWSLSYDAEADQTLVKIGEDEVVMLNGDQTGVTIAYHSSVERDDTLWVDGSGALITEAEGQNASILIKGQYRSEILGEVWGDLPT